MLRSQIFGGWRSDPLVVGIYRLIADDDEQIHVSFSVAEVFSNMT